jgi:hypothetical protein
VNGITHFQGFARLLLTEIVKVSKQMDKDADFSESAFAQELEQVIARRAYDLVVHTLWQTIPASGSTIKKYQGLGIEEIAHLLPDFPVKKSDG